MDAHARPHKRHMRHAKVTETAQTARTQIPDTAQTAHRGKTHGTHGTRRQQIREGAGPYMDNHAALSSDCGPKAPFPLPGNGAVGNVEGGRGSAVPFGVPPEVPNEVPDEVPGEVPAAVPRAWELARTTTG
eukprot:242448-Rhodomonas_salina.2